MVDNSGGVPDPSLRQLKVAADQLGFDIEEKEQKEMFDRFTSGAMDKFRLVEQLPDFLPTVKCPRTSGYEPDTEDNPYNAWYIKTNICSGVEGPLKGKTIVLKDNICLSGVKMMNGSAILEGYTPDIDATVVTRIIDAGGTIVGKAHCEDLCCSAASDTCARGPIVNPMAPHRTAGGSSSGSAALLAAREVDMSIGGDQGGSIRRPSAYCGIYGMKPTWGLVPYTGIFGIEQTIDHAGPMTNSTLDNALLLDAIAGPDGLDPRQGPVNLDPSEAPESFFSGQPLPAPQTNAYSKDIHDDITDLKIGVLKEGFSGSDMETNKCVENAIEAFKKLGASVEEVSIPMHVKAMTIGNVVNSNKSRIDQCFTDAHGQGYKGLYVTSLGDYFSQSRARNPNRSSQSVKEAFLMSQVIENQFGSHFYQKSQNLIRKLTLQYDRIFATYDLLLMPTIPIVAPPTHQDFGEFQKSRQCIRQNTAPFNHTGHPSMSIPCGKSEDGCPIGVMLVAKKLGEHTIYRASFGLEHTIDWTLSTNSHIEWL